MQDVLTKYHPLMGPASPKHGWVPAPRYLLRRARIMELIDRLPPDDLLEIGCGAGMLLHELSAKGFRCTALESSEAARELSKTLATEAGVPISIHGVPDANWNGRFGVICAFEVLEHIDRDSATLVEWASWLKPGGSLLISVPSDMSRWNARDVWAGHIRRYERLGLIGLLKNVGLEIQAFECYGFPLANFTESISARIHAKRIRASTPTQHEERQHSTARSGIDRAVDTKFFPLLNSFPGRLALRLFFWVQKRFLSTDLGNGYLVLASRKQ